MTTGYQRNALAKALEILNDEREEVGDRLDRALRLLARYRQTLISNTLRANGGANVRTGPFEGLLVPAVASEGSMAPKLLGIYEAELHPVIAQMAERGYGTIVNIGCAEGYYAVGLARRLPSARILAYDIDPTARHITKELARQHGVEDRVIIAGEFGHDDFQHLDPSDTFVLCDIEGAEIDLLVPEKAPNLAKLTLLVELHNLPEIPLYQRFLAPFRATHDIEVIEPGARDISVFEELRPLAHLDQLLAFWEWRRGPTPWVLLTPKAG